LFGSGSQQRFDLFHVELVGALVRLQLNSFLQVLGGRIILFLLGMNPGAVPVSNVTLGIEFDGAIEVSDSPIPLLPFVFGVAAPALARVIIVREHRRA
jgi:hypothetical protein